jgi:hypothetical protein
MKINILQRPFLLRCKSIFGPLSSQALHPALSFRSFGPKSMQLDVHVDYCVSKPWRIGERCIALEECGMHCLGDDDEDDDDDDDENIGHLTIRFQLFYLLSSIFSSSLSVSLFINNPSTDLIHLLDNKTPPRYVGLPNSNPRSSARSLAERTLSKDANKCYLPMLPDSKPMPNQSINICHLSSFPIISIRHENHHPLYSHTTSVLPRSRVLSYHISSFRHEAEPCLV